MNKKIESANDLTILIHEQYKTYNIHQYYKDVYDMIIQFSKNKIEPISESLSNINTHKAILHYMEQSELTEEMSKIYEEKLKEIQSKYKFMEYTKKCSNIRKKFLSDRKYLYTRIQYDKITDDNLSEIITSSILEFEDVLFSNWVDSVLLKIKPGTINIEYEDLSGKIKNILTSYKEPELNIDFSNVQPINRYSGTALFDSFLVHYFYNLITKEWDAVPIRLITNITSNNSNILEDIIIQEKGEIDE